MTLRVQFSGGGAGGSPFSRPADGGSPFGRPENMVHQTMNSSSASASRASSNNNHMRCHLRRARHLWAGVAILGVLAGCGSLPPQPPSSSPSPTVPPPPAAAPSAALPDTLQRQRSRWVKVDWAELPGWADDNLTAAWPALRAGCARPAPGWAELCARVLLGDTPANDEAARRWAITHLQPYRVESLDGAADGLITGYFEPLVAASRQPRGAFRSPLHSAPPDLATRRPYWTRQQFDTVPEAMAALRGREIAWVEDPLDVLVLQIQGSGRLRFTAADGRQQTVRLAFAGHNDQPYKSVGRWLIDQGELPADGASWPAIKAWALANPKRVQAMLWANPRVVFFREEPLPDPAVGPRGAQGVPLTAGRSIAVDPQSVPYGTPVWLETTEPLSNKPLRRLVLAQDTGSAIIGAVRADYFWGTGTDAEAQAGRMKQPLRMWVLWPHGRDATSTPPP
jgi:membrane-bound lytic murein transglycosylase A